MPSSLRRALNKIQTIFLELDIDIAGEDSYCASHQCRNTHFVKDSMTTLYITLSQLLSSLLLHNIWYLNQIFYVKNLQGEIFKEGSAKVHKYLQATFDTIALVFMQVNIFKPNLK